MSASQEETSGTSRQRPGLFPALRAVGLALFAAGALAWGAGLASAAWYRSFEVPSLITWLNVLLAVLLVAGLIQQWIRGHAGDRVQLVVISLVAPVAAMLTLWEIRVAIGGIEGGIPVPTPTLLATGDFCLLVSAVLLWPGARLRAPRRTALRAGVPVVAGVLVVGMLLSLTVTRWTAVDASTAAETGGTTVPAVPSGIGWIWQARQTLTRNDLLRVSSGVVIERAHGLLALDGRTGRPRWHYTRGNARLHSAWATFDGSLIFAEFGDGRDQSKQDNETHGDVGEHGSMTVVIDAVTGRVLGARRHTDDGGRDWSGDSVGQGREVPGTNRVRVNQNYFEGQHGSESSVLVAADLRTGLREWTWRMPRGCVIAGNANSRRVDIYTTDRVLVPFVCARDTQPDNGLVTYTYTLVALNDRTGTEAWRVEIPIRIPALPANQDSEHDEASEWPEIRLAYESGITVSADGTLVKLEFSYRDPSEGSGSGWVGVPTRVFDASTGRTLYEVPNQPTVETTQSGLTHVRNQSNVRMARSGVLVINSGEDDSGGVRIRDLGTGRELDIRAESLPNWLQQLDGVATSAAWIGTLTRSRTERIDQLAADGTVDVVVRPFNGRPEPMTLDLGGPFPGLAETYTPRNLLTMLTIPGAVLVFSTNFGYPTKLVAIR